MTHPTSNILAFPRMKRMPAPVLPVPEPRPEPVRHVEPARVSRDDRASHVATIVGASIGFARRKGVRLDNLPPQLRTWLLALCREGDPTCRMVQDWLTGNQRYRSQPPAEDL